MKYCLNYQVKEEYLARADEIKLPLEKISLIEGKFLDCAHDKTFIILVKNEISEDQWRQIKYNSILTKNNLVLCLSHYEDIEEARRNNIKFYMGYEVNSFAEFNALIEAGVSYIRIGAPLTFCEKRLIPYKDKIRAVPNIAYTGVKRKNGICGQWIRPEDTELYNSFISTLEFDESNLLREETLYKIYAIDKHWPGDIAMLISNFDAPGLNRLILPDFIKARLNCGQKCQNQRPCHICQQLVDYAQPDMYKNYI